ERLSVFSRLVRSTLLTEATWSVPIISACASWNGVQIISPINRRQSIFFKAFICGPRKCGKDVAKGVLLRAFAPRKQDAGVKGHAVAIVAGSTTHGEKSGSDPDSFHTTVSGKYTPWRRLSARKKPRGAVCRDSQPVR